MRPKNFNNYVFEGKSLLPCPIYMQNLNTESVAIPEVSVLQRFFYFMQSQLKIF